jgi:hypothetical protein
MEELLKILGVFGISAASISGIIAFLGKKYIDLVAKTELESAKNELVKNAKAYEIKLSKLHEERLVVIKSIYGKLSELNTRTFILVIAGHGDKRETPEIESLYKLFYEIKSEFMKNKILFEKDLNLIIEELISKIHHAIFKFNKIIESTDKIDNEPNSRMNNHWHKIKREDWDSAGDVIQDEVPPILERLEDEFRSLLTEKE